ncbi:hypothetical protein PHMEG_00013759 [Phytophthora megakarya]|uniref:Reverse transcriptase n=1 Tax=Phytophthora megakarya TaxID=4795 RepID=A0A225W7M6_9STRA|nr:hypothetical protein PHMEG_00013759 [Phytophthora megakarya]
MGKQESYGANQAESKIEEETVNQDEANGVSADSSNEVEAEQFAPTVPNENETMSPKAENINPLAVHKERRRRIATTVLRAEEATLNYRSARDAWKISIRFILSEENVLYDLAVNRRRRNQQQEETTLRLVVSSTMIQELYADVVRHVRPCPDCSSSKKGLQFGGYSPGNVLVERPFQVVSMDFVIPLSKSRRGDTALLLFQCAFTGFIMGKAMANTTVLRVAQAFEKCTEGSERLP